MHQRIDPLYPRAPLGVLVYPDLASVEHDGPFDQDCPGITRVARHFEVRAPERAAVLVAAGRQGFEAVTGGG